jgi:uncharacterized protein (DUF2235 family)
VGVGTVQRISRTLSYAEACSRLLGFSRGALTVRLIGGLLHRIGVLRPDARNLIPYALEPYGKHYTRMRDKDKRCQVRAVNKEFSDLFLG